MRRILILPLAILGAMVPSGTMAQPTQFQDCLSVPPVQEWCQDVSSGTLVDLGCLREWYTYEGRIAWPALRYVGPIIIEIDARRVSVTRFPLYVEFQALKNLPPEATYCDGPGRVLMTVYGSASCDTWESSGPLDLSFWLDVGDLYVIRLVFLSDTSTRFQSPYFDCIRVSTTTAVDVPAGSSTWGLVKSRYK